MSKLNLHYYGFREYLKNLKEKYKKSVSAIEQNFEIPAEEKAKQLKQLKANYKKQRIKARFSLFFK